LQAVQEEPDEESQGNGRSEAAAVEEEAAVDVADLTSGGCSNGKGATGTAGAASEHLATDMANSGRTDGMHNSKRSRSEAFEASAVSGDVVGALGLDVTQQQDDVAPQLPESLGLGTLLTVRGVRVFP
jgi:hypothetical protein